MGGPPPHLNSFSFKIFWKFILFYFILFFGPARERKSSSSRSVCVCVGNSHQTLLFFSLSLSVMMALRNHLWAGVYNIRARARIYFNSFLSRGTRYFIFFFFCEKINK
jgi:hypothetical protein